MIHSPFTAPDIESRPRRQYIADLAAMSIAVKSSPRFLQSPNGQVRFHSFPAIDVYGEIVFAGGDVDIIKLSKTDARFEYARSITPMPCEAEGGFEKEYVEALKTFVENDGIVRTLR